MRLLDRFNARKPAVGTLYLTATHLIFVDPAGKKETWVGIILWPRPEKMQNFLGIEYGQTFGQIWDFFSSFQKFVQGKRQKYPSK